MLSALQPCSAALRSRSGPGTSARGILINYINMEHYSTDRNKKARIS